MTRYIHIKRNVVDYENEGDIQAEISECLGICDKIINIEQHTYRDYEYGMKAFIEFDCPEEFSHLFN